ncbi:pectate lyase superfamily protein-domain-containing protein [Stachybotrys elegans]|uniref:Pectate lyase superfamily protein-domain-containing protein n=1 Tax=Stachybotrys elegans TaxID=80388 RepID=A0A8K0WM18_9HYPO|nr:pectate lyase superfamily protein-domain-containing protein [Stachybotrys elegans]
MPDGPVGSAPPLPEGSPQPPPPYARGHANNERSRFAPDRHNMTGPRIGEPVRGGSARMSAANQDGYWLSEFGPLGTSPFAPAGYQFFRNVRDFGAVGDGVTDDTEAINRAAAAFSLTNSEDLRCGDDCGSTTTLTAVVYFPPGDYVISSPIIQYYYTQFVGNPEARARIIGSEDFEGIALFDANVYIPDGNGDQWYVNQSNFFRQIRNFVFDMTRMPRHNYQHDQEYVPAGIHWQVGQATSITNCHFEMPLADSEGAPTAIGIFMENGSGGTVDSLSFFGGNIGFLAGSQQFTASNLQFTLCLTAIRHEWNWGFVWKNIQVTAAYIAIDCTPFSETTDPPQGTGSITVLDSHFNGVPYGITLARQNNQQPNIVLENLLVENSQSVVMVSGGETLLPGSGGALYFDNWASGYQVRGDGVGGLRSGFMDVRPNKPASLLQNGRYFLRSKPQYPGTRPLVITNLGVRNDGTGDQSSAINRALSANVGSIIFFPAGVYMIEDTVDIPPGSRIIGSGWSTIMGTGSRFEDENDPHVMIRVGRDGDVGSVEITDMLFTVRGPVAGAVLMEWNLHESSQGSAAMWDSHFRVGGNAGSDLLLDDCPARTGSVDRGCMAANMLLHLTRDSSAFFYNVWIWVADHDLDDPNNANAHVGPGGIPENSMVEISVYVARGVLIESQGPLWFWGSSSEHSQLYQWQMLNARNIFMGHMQTETAYYQADPDALEPYETGSWPGDPSFDHCDGDDGICLKGWALRIINSSDILLYGMGFYSFFDNFRLGCAPDEQCQQSLIETNYAGNLYMYNIFTKGNIEIVTPRGNLPPVWFNDTTRNGYTSNIAAYLALAGAGGRDIGSGEEDGSSGGTDVVYIDPIIWDSSNTPTIQCIPPCTYILPPSVLDSPTTIRIPPLTTSLEVGWFESTSYVGPDGEDTTTTVFVSITQTTTITIPPIITTQIEIWNEIIQESVNSTVITARSSIPIPPIIVVDDPDPLSNGTSNPPVTRTITPPPWPWPENESSPTPTTTNTRTTTTSGGDDDDDDDDDDDIGIIPIIHTIGPPRPTCRSGCGSQCRFFCDRPCLLFCPPGGGGLETGGFIAPNNPNNPVAPTSSCEVETYSDCNTWCIATPTSSCTTSCSNVIGCDTTGTEVAATVTPADYNVGGRKGDWITAEPFSNLLNAGQEVIEYLSERGHFGNGKSCPLCNCSVGV